MAPTPLTETKISLIHGDFHGVDTFPEHTFHFHRGTGERFSSSVCCDPNVAIPADLGRSWYCLPFLLLGAQALPQHRVNDIKQTETVDQLCLLLFFLFFLLSSELCSLKYRKDSAAGNSVHYASDVRDSLLRQLDFQYRCLGFDLGVRFSQTATAPG